MQSRLQQIRMSDTDTVTSKWSFSSVKVRRSRAGSIDQDSTSAADVNNSINNQGLKASHLQGIQTETSASSRASNVFEEREANSDRDRATPSLEPINKNWKKRKNIIPCFICSGIILLIVALVVVFVIFFFDQSKPPCAENDCRQILTENVYPNAASYCDLYSSKECIDDKEKWLLIQNYALYVIYYSTLGNTSWEIPPLKEPLHGLDLTEEEMAYDTTIPTEIGLLTNLSKKSKIYHVILLL